MKNLKLLIIEPGGQELKIESESLPSIRTPIFRSLNVWKASESENRSDSGERLRSEASDTFEPAPPRNFRPEHHCRGLHVYLLDCFAPVFWDDSSSSGSDLAFNFVYEVMVWIGHSNCVHFAFKRMIRIMADGLDDAKRRML